MTADLADARPRPSRCRYGCAGRRYPPESRISPTRRSAGSRGDSETYSPSGRSGPAPRPRRLCAATAASCRRRACRTRHACRPGRSARFDRGCGRWGLRRRWRRCWRHPAFRFRCRTNLRPGRGRRQRPIARRRSSSGSKTPASSTFGLSKKARNLPAAWACLVPYWATRTAVMSVECATAPLFERQC